MFGVTILGNNSAVPAYNRHPTAQIVTIHDQLLLIDCGEGTQMQMARYKIRRSKIRYIFISHLHGDHYFGLIGLIASLALIGREDSLHVFGPPLLKEMIDLQLKAADTMLPFPLYFSPLVSDGLLVDEKKFTVECFSTYHRVECKGFIVREKRKLRKINKLEVLKYPIPAIFYERLKDGEDYTTKDGDIIKNEWVTMPSAAGRSYAYSGDTLYDHQIAGYVKGVNLLYHETTYLKTMTENAKKRFHSTTHQAATIALEAGVGKLIIGHFSSKYENIDVFLEEVKEVFENSDLAIEGVTYMIPFAK
ncbi:ribonuclease Z [Parasediminibacterium sp. JCM 36343]|uniref:ribonuclease Z n=1 Tax=Parasediminibacterium sp. JCM 36343 TaxID=3374279 RepID=UPI00397B6A64